MTQASAMGQPSFCLKDHLVGMLRGLSAWVHVRGTNGRVHTYIVKFSTALRGAQYNFYFKLCIKKEKIQSHCLYNFSSSCESTGRKNEPQKDDVV